MNNNNISQRDEFYLLELNPESNNVAELLHKVNVVRKINSYNFIIRKVDESNKQYLRENSIGLYAVNNLWKLSPGLLSEYEYSKIIYPQYIQVILKGKIERNSIKWIQMQLLQSQFDSRHQTITGLLPNKAVLDNLLINEHVIFIESPARKPTEEAAILDYNQSVNALDFTRHIYGFEGNGVAISIKELLYNETDLDLLGKHIQSNEQASLTNQHATSMASIIAGRGNSYSTGRGVMPNAKLTNSSFENLWADSIGHFNQSGATIQNHSYGTKVENYYGSFARSYDQLVYNQPEILHVFSSGNSGTAKGSAGIYSDTPGFANLTGNFKMSKNTLAVGALDSTLQVQNEISKGPAYDGRIKPELVAYSSSGSSGAAALVSAAAGMLQHFFKIDNDSNPDAALLKSILINGADDVLAPGPDFIYGYGNLNIARSLEILKDKNYWQDHVRNQDSSELLVYISDSVKSFKATLAWTDPPATLNAYPALVNDLDFKVIAPDGQVFLPWQLNPYPSVDSLTKSAIKGRDNLNVVEQIWIDEPIPGNYKLIVTGENLETDHQDFSVSYEMLPEGQFKWYSPHKFQLLPQDAERAATIRWHSSIDEESARLFYKTLNSENWILVDEEVNLRKSFIRYRFPELNEEALVKMEIAGKSYLSDTFFISYPVQPKIGFDCTDSLLVMWNRQGDNIRYQINHLIGEEMQSIYSTSDTSIVIMKKELRNNYLSVTPQVLNRTSLHQSYTFDYQLQGVGCYVISFNAESKENSIMLSLNLGTGYMIKEVVFESINGQERFRRPVKISNQRNVTVPDENPQSGINQYKAILVFENGQKLEFNSNEVYYVPLYEFALFPNPLNAAESLQIVSNNGNEFPVLFSVYDLNGQKTMEQTIRFDRQEIGLGALPGGTYIYTITSRNVLQRGKIIIN